MAAPKLDTTAAVAADPVKAVPAAEAKTAEPKAPDMRVESVPQYIDEYDVETAMRLMRAHLIMSEEVRKNGGGRWELPSSHSHIRLNGRDRTHRATRLGTMSDVRSRDKILRHRFALEQRGWKLAPPGTRNSLYLTDGDQGVYMILPEVVGLVHDEHEKETRRKLHERRFSRSVNSLPDDLQQAGLRNVSFDKVDVQQGKMSVDDFRRMK